MIKYKEKGFETLKTKRLILRKLYLKDTKQYFEVIDSSKAVSEYTLWEPHRKIAKMLYTIN